MIKRLCGELGLRRRWTLTISVVQLNFEVKFVILLPPTLLAPPG